MGIGDSGILAAGTDLTDISLETINCMVDGDTELISIYFGKDATEEQAQALADRLAQAHPECEVEVHSGGQPVYYYLISAE